MLKKIILIIFIYTFILNILISCKPSLKKEEDQIISVKITKVKLSGITSHTTQIGTVKALEEAKISSKVSGKISKIYVQEGNFVSEGQTLILLDQTDLTAQLRQAQAGLVVTENGLAKVLAGSRIEAIEQARANLNQAKANLANNKANLERMEELYNQQVITKQTLESTQTQYKVAFETVKTASEQLRMLKRGATKEDINISKSQVQQAKAGVNLVKQQLDNTLIRSPFSGIISQKFVNSGEVINPSAPLFTLVQMGTVKIRVDISETLLKYFTTGESAKIKLDAYPDLTFDGIIKNISPVVNPQARTFWAEVFINNPNYLIKPGMFAKITFDIETHFNVLTVPLEAVFNKGEHKYVYIVKNNIVNLSPSLKCGITTNSEVEIIEGLKINDEIVIRGMENLVDKAKVKVIR